MGVGGHVRGLGERSIAELIAATLSDDESDEGAEQELGSRDPEAVLRALAPLTRAPGERERARAADVLAKLGTSDAAFRTRCVDVILAALALEKSVPVLWSMACALGHFEDPRIVDALWPLQAHPSVTVRLAVVFGLPTSPDGVAALIERSKDSDVDVRSWATFELAAAPVDTEAVREAFLARLADADPEVRGEALVGLARRRDPRTRAALERELAASFDDLALDAACELADPALLPCLRALQSSVRGEAWSGACSRAIEVLDSQVTR